MSYNIAVIAVQGAFEEHAKVINRLGSKPHLIRNKKEYASSKWDGLILPGGESTTMRKLITELELYDSISEDIQSGLPVFGTCSGLILLANEVEKEAGYFSLLDATVERNSYGRQLGSFTHKSVIKDVGAYEMVFIRAPRIVNVGKGVEVLSTVNDDPVMVRSHNVLACSFHPELTDATNVHEYFLEKLVGSYVNV